MPEEKATANCDTPGKWRAPAAGLAALIALCTFALLAFQSVPHRLAHLDAHSRGITGLEFLPSGSNLISAGQDGRIVLWDAAEHKQLSSFRTEYTSFTALAVARDGKRAIAGDKQGRLWLFETDALRRVRTVQTDSAQIAELAFSPDSRLLAVASARGLLHNDARMILNRRAISILNTSDCSVHRELEGHNGGVYCVAFSPDGSTLCSGGLDKSVRLWNVKSGACTGVMQGHDSAVYAVDFSPDGRTAASLSCSPAGVSLEVSSAQGAFEVSSMKMGIRLVPAADGVRVWNVADLSQKRKLTDTQSVSACVRFGPKGKLLAAAENNTVTVWKMPGYKPRLTTCSDDVVTTLCFSPDGRTLAWGKRNGGIEIWKVR